MACDMKLFKNKRKKNEALLCCNDSHLVLQGQSEPTKMDKVADRRRKVTILRPNNASLLCWDNVACGRSVGIVTIKVYGDSVGD